MKKATIREGRQSKEKVDKLDEWIAQITHDDSIKKPSFSKKKKTKKAVKPVEKTGRKSKKQKTKKVKKGKKLRVIPIGGLEEVGKNAMVFEYDDDIVVVDMGFEFPDEDMLGIDYIVPDVTYLQERQRNIRGLIITHGHMDHIGGLRYILPKIGFPPVYGTKLTLGLVKKYLDEQGILKECDLREISSDDCLKLGRFQAKFFRVNHSIPDGVGVYLKSPVGSVVHTGDFKFDPTPADDIPAEVNKMRALGKKKGFERVDVLFSDSTNALKPGRTVSEKVIGESLDKVIGETEGRIIIASFSSLIGRIQQVLNSAKKHGRKVIISGRSMEDNVAIARNLGYLKVPKGVIVPMKEGKKMKPNKVLIITTGSQGEAMSALTRMSLNDHKHIKIAKGDTVIISAHPIIGNEKAVANVINNLCKLGANIVSNNIMDVHTSGHGRQEDLEQMIRLVRPKNLAPIHGNLYMRTAHAKIGKKCGLLDENLFLFGENGVVMEIDRSGVKMTNETVPSNYIVVDGFGMGDVGSQVLHDRQAMAQNGVVVVVFRVKKKTKKLAAEPLVITRGFLYMDESEEFVEKLKKEAGTAYEQLLHKDKKANAYHVCNYVGGVLNRAARKMLARNPLIVPWVTYD